MHERERISRPLLSAHERQVPGPTAIVDSDIGKLPFGNLRWTPEFRRRAHTSTLALIDVFPVRVVWA